jgi:hypothetical protein
VTLLERIILAAEGDGSVPSLLRMLKTLASRTGTAELGEWANRELVGYPSKAPVPGYRGPFEMQVYATFHDGYGRRDTNVPIDTKRFPAEVRELLFQLSFREPIAEIQAYVEQESSTNFAWTPDVVLDYNRAVMSGEVLPVMVPGWQMESAAGHIPKSRIAGILDQVRTVAHDLALEVEQSAPTAGEPGTSAEMNAKAAIIITNNFDFSNANLSGSNNAINSSGFSQNITMPEKGDRASLEQVLREAGVSDSEIARLRAAIAEDTDASEGGVGSRVREWLREQTSGVLPAVATVITQAVFAFYGLPVGG